jgi:hypothetical protein
MDCLDVKNTMRVLPRPKSVIMATQALLPAQWPANIAGKQARSLIFAKHGLVVVEIVLGTIVFVETSALNHVLRR